MKRGLLLIPLLLFLVLLGFLAAGLRHDPSEIPSPLIGKPAPQFTLPQLFAPGQTFSSQNMRGQPWLLNVWASWCESCQAEHAALVDFARGHRVTIIGLDYKDDPADARSWLARAGDPYDQVAVDADGAVGINFGVYGVPETYVIDPQGRIRRKIIGAVTPQTLQDQILPLLASLKP